MIGRKEEIELLRRLLDSDESEFVAVYGRRRVGKTYLIRETFDGRFSFVHTGLPRGNRRQQLVHFARSLESFGGGTVRIPQNWFAAFDALKGLLARTPSGRKVVFIDEMPWMDTPKSDFMMALESFWNEWASARKDVLLVVCGSAASWMVKNLFRNRGGLHNRVTARLFLQPFTLQECEQFAAERGLSMGRRDLAECYMALGGIPYYWRYLAKGLGVAQNFDQMFFAQGAPLREEFDELYSSLFKHAEIYKSVVSALATKKMGMTRRELVEALNLSSAGKLTDALDTLESSGFVRSYRFLGRRSRETTYQLIDCFTLFHFRFLDGRVRDERYWSSTISSSGQSVWRGLSFEMLCLLHFRQIRAALGVAGVHAEAYSWRHQGDDTYPHGVQIDLLIDRADNVINVCEMKWCAGKFAIDRAYEALLKNKVATLSGVTGTHKSIHLTLVTTDGVLRNQYAGCVQSEITLDDLFV